MEYSEAIEKEYQELVDFWNRNAGWDHLTLESWSDRFLTTPEGSPSFIIGRENGKIMGQLIFIPVRIFLGEKMVKGCRPFAAAVDLSAQKLTGYKIIIQLYNFGVKLMKGKGFDLMVMLPDPRWKPLSRFIDVSVASFPLYQKLILQENQDSPISLYHTKAIDFDTIEIERLWEEVKKQHLYMVSRDRETLKWKNSHRDYRILGVFQNEKLTGVATYIEKVPEKQIQICDLLYSIESEKKAVLENVSSFLNKEYVKDKRFEKLVILVTESIKECLVDIGYVPDNYQFLFTITRLNKNIPKKTLNISQWYLSAND